MAMYQLDGLTIPQRQEIADRAQEAVNETWREHQLSGDPPNVSPGLVGAVLDATRQVAPGLAHEPARDDSST